MLILKIKHNFFSTRTPMKKNQAGTSPNPQLKTSSSNPYF